MHKSSRNSAQYRIAYFISSHGFGHAARASAVMSALHELDLPACFEIFSNAPIQFFQNSLSGPFFFHRLETDVGMVQKTPFCEDLESTFELLKAFLPFDPYLVEGLARQISEFNCQLVICDIAPMGLAVAKAAGIPSILIENFTWDWIYETYANKNRYIKKNIDYLKDIFQTANYHIQAKPVCRHRQVDLTTEPVGRKVRASGGLVRQHLNIPPGFNMLTITMGGVPNEYDYIRDLEKHDNIYFVIPGASRSTRARNNLIFLAQHSEFFHPDLINASDAVIGKAGYSTIAEIYYAGIPFGYISRPAFRESATLTTFIKENMSGTSIQETEFHDGSWTAKIPDILDLPRFRPHATNGANQIANFIIHLLN